VPTLAERLQGDLNAARKAQDKATTLVLGTVLADLKNRQLELRSELPEGEAADVLRRAIKRRRESIDIYEKAGRNDLAAAERREVEVLERYLPAQVGDDELRAAVRAAIAAGAGNVGAVMGRVMPEFKGRADGARLNAIAREELARRQ
jgi:uncharacterized protein YqeY